MCDNDTPLKKRRTVMNRVLVVLSVIALIVTAFEFGKFQENKNQFVQPHHFSWNTFCASKGGDQALCSCMEKEMIKDLGRNPAKSKNEDQTILNRALETCKTVK